MRRLEDLEAPIKRQCRFCREWHYLCDFQYNDYICVDCDLTLGEMITQWQNTEKGTLETYIPKKDRE